MDATTAGNGGEVMGKEAYYFSHDSNARQDPKVSAMLSVYGAEGYGYYWMIVEMLREEATHTLDISGKYSFNAFALQLHCTPEKAKEFISDCINEFSLFDSDGEHFWSNSLLRRMAMREEVSQKRKKAAEKRWGKKPGVEPSDEKENANAMQLHGVNDANAMQGKERKGKEKKEKEIKDKDIKIVRSKKTFELDSPEIVLADFFVSEIRKNKPDFKQPNLQTWAEDIRKIVELDKRDKREVALLMRWVQTDDFEMTNVLSPSKLRTRYDNLAMKMNKTKGANNYAATTKRHEQSSSEEYDGLSL